MLTNTPAPLAPKSRFSAYADALKAISKRTGTPLPSLILSFGIVHELTALIPLVGVFYASRALGIGEAVVTNAVTDSSSSRSAVTGGEESWAVRWGREKAREWVEEGDKWAERVGRRYNVFGYEKKAADSQNPVPEHGHRIVGDVANAVVAYGVTKVGTVIMVLAYLDPWDRHCCLLELEYHCIWPLDSREVCWFRRGRLLLGCSEGLSRELGYVLSYYLQAGAYESLDHVLSDVTILITVTAGMPKLHFKRTAEEIAARRQDKRKARRRKRGYEDGDTRQRPRAKEGYSERKWVSSDEDQETEEMRFQEKLSDAFADDERLDSLEARLNDYAHMPDRWRTRFEDDVWLKADPQTMDEEQYVEWIRVGMYRKTHADEYAEQQKHKARHKAAQAARRADEKRRKKKIAKEDSEQDAQDWADARTAYDHRWTMLLSLDNRNAEIGFADIPWPARSHHRSPVMADLTVDAVAAFLLPSGMPQKGRTRKEVLRETLLRFHPDKFEGRLMAAVRTEEQAVVREGIGRVVRALNSLMAE